jgi:tRNA threonylcarbamoyladenosine biosynthesis protein TsaB
MILGIDTTSRRGGVALLAPEGSLVTRDLGPQGGHAERLVPALLELLREAGADWNAVRRIAVAVGPGSFTGVRVGIAGALGLSRARGIPLVGVGSLDILARACYDATSPETGGYIIAAQDVRRGEVALASYAVTGEGPRLEAAERLAAVADPGPAPPSGTRVAGEGSFLLWPGAPGLVRWPGTGEALAAAVARIGGERVDLAPPVPRYAREADARPRVTR